LAYLVTMQAVDHHGSRRGKVTAPAIDVVGQAPDRAGDHDVVGIERRRSANIDDGRRGSRPELGMKGLRSSMGKALSIHAGALLASRELRRAWTTAAV
jgi:hypothetical protein